MGEATRRTAEHRKIAATIDARMKQLDALHLQEAEIMPAMAEHMEDFHRLVASSTATAITNHVIDAGRQHKPGI